MMMRYDEIPPTQCEEVADDDDDDDDDDDEEEELSMSTYPVNGEAVNEPHLFAPQGNLHADRKISRAATNGDRLPFPFAPDDDEGERPVSPLHGIDPFA